MLFWIRLGDGAEYESYDSHIDAAWSLADYFAQMGDPDLDMLGEEEKDDRYYDKALNFGPDDFHWHYDGAGFDALPFFEGQNYISAYWGDEESNLVRGTNKKEQREFKVALKKYYDGPIKKVVR